MPEAKREFEDNRIRELEHRADMWRRQYHLLLEILPEAVYLQDESGNLVSTNSAGVRLTGFSSQELLCMKIGDVLTPDFSDQAMSGITQFSAAAELLTRDCTRRPVAVHVSILREPSGPMLVQYLVREDVAEKRAEDPGHAETRFRLMAKNLSEMFLAYDMNRRLTFANTAAET